MKNKKILLLISLLAVSILAIFFIPIPQGALDDGGTRVYKSMTYTVVSWHKLVDVVDENGNSIGPPFYDKTSVYWFPDNSKSIDELWKLEMQKFAPTWQSR